MLPIPRLSLLAWLAIAGLVAAGTVGGLVATGKLSVTPGGAGAFYSFPGVSIPAGCSGFSALSVDKTPVISNDADLQILNYLITAKFGGSECFTGTVSQQQLSTNQGPAAKSLTIVASNLKERVNYDVQSTGTGTIHRPTYWPIDATGTSNPTIALSGDNAGATGDGVVWVKQGFPLPVCLSGQADVAPAYEVILSSKEGFFGKWWTLYCVGNVPVGEQGTVRGPGFTTTGDVQACADSACSSARVDVSEAAGQEISMGGSLVARVTPQFVGLVPGVAQPSTGGFASLYIKGKTVWHIVPEADINSYNSQYGLVLGKASSNNVLSKGATANAVGEGYLAELNSLNNQWNTLEARDTNLVPGLARTISPSSGGGQLVYEGRPTYSALIATLWVRADSVNVVMPVGVPQILSLTPASFSSGSQGQIGVKASNAGAVLATFDFSASCAAPAYAQPVLQVPIGAGATLDVSIPVSVGTSAVDSSGSCTVSMCDHARPTKCATLSTTYSASKPSQCVGIAEGETRVVGSTIVTCQGGFVKQTSCPLGVAPDQTRCLTTADKIEVVAPPSIPTPIPTAQIPTGGFVTKAQPPWLLIAAVAAGVVAAIVVTAVVMRRRGGGLPPRPPRGAPGVR